MNEPNKANPIRVKLIAAGRIAPYWIIWGPVAPCRSNRDGKIRSNHAELHRTGWSYCATYYRIAESAESTERRRKTQKGQKAQKGAERYFLGQSGQKNRCKSRRLNRWLIWSVRSVPGLRRKLYIINKLWTFTKWVYAFQAATIHGATVQTIALCPVKP